MRKAKLIEPIGASFEDVMKKLLNAPDSQIEEPKTLLKVDHNLNKWLNKITCGDCLEVMRELPTGSISCIVTSPPYNIKNSSGNGLKNGSGGKWPKAELIKGYDSHDDNMPHDKYVEWQRECLTESQMEGSKWFIAR
jgi:site-specific DNA-methyltransferase (adenine-specific)